MAVVNEYTQVTIFWFPAFGATRSVMTKFDIYSPPRAGGKGTAGTAMAVPVFEGEKMASLGF